MSVLQTLKFVTEGSLLLDLFENCGKCYETFNIDMFIYSHIFTNNTSLLFSVVRMYEYMATQL